MWSCPSSLANERQTDKCRMGRTSSISNRSRTRRRSSNWEPSRHVIKLHRKVKARTTEPIRATFPQDYGLALHGDELVITNSGHSEDVQFYATRREHSAKPEGLQDWLDCLPGPRCELFARRPRPGWTCIGAELGLWVTPSGIERRAAPIVQGDLFGSALDLVDREITRIEGGSTGGSGE